MTVERIRLPKRRAATPETTSPPARGGRVRVWLRSRDYRLIDQASIRLVSAVERMRAAAEGPVPFPVERDQEDARVHVRRIDITMPSRKVLETLQNFDLPAGVSISLGG